MLTCCERTMLWLRGRPFDRPRPSQSKVIRIDTEAPFHPSLVGGECATCGATSHLTVVVGPEGAMAMCVPCKVWAS